MSEPKLNRSEHFCEVRGEEPAWYLQDGNYFTRAGDFVKEAPAGFTRSKKALPKITGVTRERVMARANALLAGRSAAGVLQSVAEAEKENLKAAEAETKAD